MTGNKRKKIIIITLCFAAVGICIAIVLGLKTWREGLVTQYPKKTFSVIIDLGQREKLFEQLEKFADASDFDINIGPTTPEGDTFNIYMSRKDVMVIGDNVVDLSTFDISFYDKDPANPVSEEVIDDLVNDLKNFISEIPGVEIVEE